MTGWVRWSIYLWATPQPLPLEAEKKIEFYDGEGELRKTVFTDEQVEMRKAA
jgi:hypothetical protein